MARKRHTPEEIVAKLRQVDVLLSQRQAVADAIRGIGVSKVTYYRWRQEFGGLKADQVKRLSIRPVTAPWRWLRRPGDLSSARTCVVKVRGGLLDGDHHRG